MLEKANCRRETPFLVDWLVFLGGRSATHTPKQPAESQVLRAPRGAPGCPIFADSPKGGWQPTMLRRQVGGAAGFGGAFLFRGSEL